MYVGDRQAGLEPADATAISYTLIRHLGLMLDELSAQGLQVWQDERQAWRPAYLRSTRRTNLLQVWQDERQAWRWAWTATEVRSERGFWAIGEAIVDAVVTRYPAAFDSAAVLEV